MTEDMEQRLAYLLRMPWTVVPETTAEGDRVLRIAEIPSATGCGDTEAEREADLWESLRESLRALLHFGDPVPLPRGQTVPWLEGAAATPGRIIVTRDSGVPPVGTTGPVVRWEALPQ